MNDGAHMDTRLSQLLTRGSQAVLGKIEQRQNGKRVMEVIYNLNDKRLRWRQSATEAEERW